MSIQTIRFSNHATGWRLKDVSFGSAALLLGLSGAGKSLILRAISSLRRIACGEAVSGAEWELTFEGIGGGSYRWSGRYCVQDRQRLIPSVIILEETLECDDRRIISRKPESFQFQQMELPRLSAGQSAVFLLSEEPSVRPAWEALSRIIDGSAEQPERTVLSGELENTEVKLAELQASPLSVREKLFVLERQFPEEFGSLVQTNQEAFPSIMNIHTFFDDSQSVRMEFQEKGVDGWIHEKNLSSGMKRTILHIAELSLYPDHSVILIDEFESSLGINCIGLITDEIMNFDRGLQPIATTHDPYVINSIPKQYWKIVQRDGSEVCVKDFNELTFDEDSSHDDYLKLINSPEFQEGVL